MTKAYWIIALLLACSCNEPDLQPQIDGLKQDVVTLAGWVDTLAVRQESNFERIEQLQLSDARQDAELVRISDRLEQWPYDSLVWLRNEIVTLSRKLAVMSGVLDSLKGPVGTPDSLGNVCYTLDPGEVFNYKIKHNFLDIEGGHEWRIKLHTALEIYNSVQDMYANNGQSQSVDYKWYDWTYDQFMQYSVTSVDGRWLYAKVQIMFPERGKVYVIAHEAIDNANPPNHSAWNRSIDEGYYVRVK